VIRTAAIFGGLAAALLILIQLSKWSWLGMGIGTDALAVLFAAAFLALGFVFQRIIGKSPQDEAFASKQRTDYEKYGISPREFEVLEHMAGGLSNKEIGQALFISESTVKTHVSQLLAKLDAKRRSQAIAKAREVGII
jgi:DNA-binding CsgD family transcriptional regulator